MALFSRERTGVGQVVDVSMVCCVCVCVCVCGYVCAWVCVCLLPPE